MLVDALANPAPAGATESTVLGPFYVPGAPLREYGANIAEQAAGDAGLGPRARPRPRRRSRSRAPSSTSGRTATTGSTRCRTPTRPDDHLRGRFHDATTTARFAFLAVRPVPYPIPDDGPVGRMLDATGRHPWRPAHIHIVVRAAGYRTLATHIFDARQRVPRLRRGLRRQAVAAARRSSRARPDDPRAPPGVAGPWFSVERDLVLAPGADAREPSDPGRTALTSVHETAERRIVFGAGALATLADEVARLGHARPLVIAGRSHAARGERLDRGARRRRQHRRRARPRAGSMAADARAQALALGADCLVAIGGGSAVGLAKAVALTRAGCRSSPCRRPTPAPS